MTRDDLLALGEMPQDVDRVLARQAGPAHVSGCPGVVEPERPNPVSQTEEE